MRSFARTRSEHDADVIRAERLARRAVSRTLGLLVDLPLRLATAPKAGAVFALDSSPIFQFEALRCFRTAVDLGGIHPSDLIVHLTLTPRSSVPCHERGCT